MEIMAMRGNKRFGIARGGLFAAICLAMLAAGCSKSEQADVTFDTSRLPRVAGAKQIFASPATTIFTSPDSVAQTADSVEKALAAGGWQKYVAPNTSYTKDPTIRTMFLKKDQQALSVFITIAPAQNNATSVQYGAVALKTDLPFTKDATDIEYSPDRPLLSLVTAEPADKTLDFYRKELGARGWALWSEKTNGKQAAGGPSGSVRARGASAEYVNDKEPTVALVLTMQKAETGKFKLELKEWPIGILESEHQAYLNSPNSAEPVDVSLLPRLAGAKEDASRSSSDRLSYDVPGSVADTVAATRKLLAADGWKEFVSPSEQPGTTSIYFKKGPQGLYVSFTMAGGQESLSNVSYGPHRINFDLPFPDAATDIVFDEYRTYLNCITAGTVDATHAFFDKALAASGWSRLSATDAAARWPGAKLDEKIANGALAYYISETQRPIVLSLQRGADDKTKVEIKIPPFAQPQVLEAGEEIFGMPRPKGTKTAGGTGGQTARDMHATVPAEVSTVLAFYRRELAARNWKEETQGAIANPDEVMLNFSAVDGGTAVLKLGHKYDLTTVSLVEHLPKPVAKNEPAAKDDSVDAIMKQAQQMVRDATADALAGMKPPKMAQASNDPVEALRPLAGNDAPVPVPETAEDIDFASGRLEFNSASNIKAVAEFYRSTMKQQGWEAQSSVINNANMVVLNFSKARKSVSFTIMKMGNKTNVTADGSALKVAAATPAAPDATPADKAPSANAPVADAPTKVSEEDLVAEESGGLPVPKRHTMIESEKTRFRRDLNASVPMDIATVLGFYRRELGKLNWKEDTKGAVVAADNAVIAFSAPEGPAVLKLGRKDGETSVNLTVKNPDAAKKAGVMPKPGQVKLLLGNPMPAEAMVTINKQTIKVAAGIGAKAPDGPTLDLAPGKYKFSVKLPGLPAHDDELNVGADETWGLMIVPGGALPLRAY
jgi:hypothetical protein